MFVWRGWRKKSVSKQWNLSYLKKESVAFESRREFVEVVKEDVSPSSQKHYAMRLVLKVARYSSGAWYGKSRKKLLCKKRGLQPTIADEELLPAIQEVLATNTFHSEGYQKVHARTRRKGICVAKRRVLAMMRNNNLLAPVRPRPNGSARAHNGTITRAMPNEMWETDGKQFWTIEKGRRWFFSVIDHCNDEILSWHVAKVGNRFTALEPVRAAVKKEYGAISKGIVADTGLFLRSDHGSRV